VGRDRKHIVLDLLARVDEVVGNIEDFQSAPVIFASGPTQSVQRPVVDGREFQTRMVVEDGGTVIIGGLLKNYQEEVTRRVPVLGQIPLLGLLFRYTKNTVKQSNLVIVVEARIVAPSGQYYASDHKGRANPAEGGFDFQSVNGRPVAPDWIQEFEPELRGEVLSPE
jgi:type II secretory pathway component GspD/PulD (secretin)